MKEQNTLPEKKKFSRFTSWILARTILRFIFCDPLLQEVSPPWKKLEPERKKE